MIAIALSGELFSILILTAVRLRPTVAHSSRFPMTSQHCCSDKVCKVQTIESFLVIAWYSPGFVETDCAQTGVGDRMKEVHRSPRSTAVLMIFIDSSYGIVIEQTSYRWHTRVWHTRVWQTRL